MLFNKKVAKTPETIEKRRRFWQRARRRLGWTLAALFVAHLGLNIYASVLLNRELAAIRQKGEPLQFAEMAPPAVPDAQNAALIYKQATNALHFSPGEKIAFRIRESNRTPQINRDIEAALAKNRKTLDLTRRAAAMPQCRFPLDYDTASPTALLFTYYGEMRELARLMAAQANSEAKNGDKAAALRDVRAIFNMAHHLSNEPVLIGYLVAQVVEAIANKALSQVLETVPLGASEARSFEDSLPHDDWNRGFRRVLMGERSWGVPSWETLGPAPTPDMFSVGDDYRPPVWLTYRLLLLWRPVQKLDEVQMLRLWRLLLDSSLYQQVPRPVGAEQSFDAAIQNVPFYAVLTRILFPVFSRASDNRDFAEVRRRQREVALALAVYRTAKGQYPKQLQEAAVEWKKPLPLDLYSQKSFGYRREEKGFILYSVGVNRTDNKGGGRMGLTMMLVRPGDLTALDDILWGGARFKNRPDAAPEQ